MIDEPFPFAAYSGALETAIAGRAKIVVRVVCGNCQHQVASVCDSPLGALYFAQLGLPSALWVLQELKQFVPDVAHYPTATSTDLVEWDGDRPPRMIAARCRDDGELRVSLAELRPAVAEYRRSSKVQRVAVPPSSSMTL